MLHASGAKGLAQTGVLEDVQNPHCHEQLHKQSSWNCAVLVTALEIVNNLLDATASPAENSAQSDEREKNFSIVIWDS